MMSIFTKETLEKKKPSLNYWKPKATPMRMLAEATADFPTPAQRPLYSALDYARFEQTFGLRLLE